MKDQDKITTAEMKPAPEESIAFAAGRKAREMRIPLRQSALRALRPGSRQYDDFIDGYDYEAEQRKRKPKAALAEQPMTIEEQR